MLKQFRLEFTKAKETLVAQLERDEENKEVIKAAWCAFRDRMVAIGAPHVISRYGTELSRLLSFDDFITLRRLLWKSTRLRIFTVAVHTVDGTTVLVIHAEFETSGEPVKDWELQITPSTPTLPQLAGRRMRVTQAEALKPISNRVESEFSFTSLGDQS